MENKNFMVSEEIADQIDESQFRNEQESEVDDISQHIVIHLESEKTLIPGIIIKYDYRLKNIEEEEISFSFLTKNENIIDFQKNIKSFSKAKLLLGSESIREYDLSGMIVKRLTVEQTPTQAGCVITVAYNTY